VAWIAVGALIVHIGIRLPLIRDGLGTPLMVPTLRRAGLNPRRAGPAPRRAGPAPRRAGSASGNLDPPPDVSADRRTFLRATWLATAGGVLATAGTTVPWLRRVSPLAWSSGRGPQGLPVNKTAAAAGIRVPAGWRLEVVWPGGTATLTLADLAALPQRTARLPIACVEGWSATATWTGVAVRDLLAAVGAPAGRPIKVSSLQRVGAYATSTLPAKHAADPLTLLALGINGEVLHPDHGYPCRVIAPSLPGVLQTKWVIRLEIQ
jgi:DMSO/TMAO reductase YedYZ molybdopterin-dependent catalytic subunit